jgi:hypothetical protein
MLVEQQVEINNYKYIYLPDVIQWRERYSLGSDTLTAQTEKARLNKFRTNKIELEYNAMLGKTIEK